jgi:hypothetical protein
MFIMHYANTFGRRVPEKKHLKLQARRQRVKKVMKMLRGVPKTHVLGQPYSVLFSRFMMDFNQNVQKPWVFEAIDFIGANAMRIKTRPLTGAVTMFGHIWTYLDPLFKYLKFRYLRICFVCCVVSLERSIVSRASFRSRSRLHFVLSLGSVCGVSDTVRQHLHIFTLCIFHHRFHRSI